jgi:hypothetical protein
MIMLYILRPFDRYRVEKRVSWQRCALGTWTSGFMIAALLTLHQGIVAQENDLRVSADNWFYYAHDSYIENEAYRDLMEDWTAVTLGYGDFDANVVYEAHLPPPSWSQDTTGQGIYERWITYKRDGFSATAGNFYALLGKGITLKSFRNRDMRYNSNIDGAQFVYTNRFLDITALGGRPRDFSGLRLNPLQAAEVRVTPAGWGFLGGTYVQTKLFSDMVASRWGSAYMQLQRDFGSLYTEFASRNFGKGNNSGGMSDYFLKGTGTAFYSSGNFFIKDISALMEAAYYNNFDISEGIEMYNSPPPATKEHSNALMSRVAPSLFAANHTSLHGSVTYAISDENNVTADLTRSRAVKEGERGGTRAFTHCADFIDYTADYSDIFVKGEVVYPSTIDWTLGSGYQKTLEAGYLNFVGSNDWGIIDNYSLQGVLEHQWTTIDLTERKYYSQLYSLTFARASAPRLSLACIVERTTDQYSDRKYWIGAQLNWTFYENNEIVVFAGQRKKGKICSGGVCVNKPEFSGVEVTFTSRL